MASEKWHEKNRARIFKEGLERDRKSLDAFLQRAEEISMEQPEHIMQFFEYLHLPTHLQAVSKPFHDLAHDLVGDYESPGAPGFPLPRNPERTVALRKLLEAKDAAVRAFLAK